MGDSWVDSKISQAKSRLGIFCDIFLSMRSVKNESLRGH